MADQRQLYLEKFANRLEKLLRAEGSEWKDQARLCERMLRENGRIPIEVEIRYESPFQFVLDAVSENDLVLENSGLLLISERNWNPENAISASDLVSYLLL